MFSIFRKKPSLPEAPPTSSVAPYDKTPEFAARLGQLLQGSKFLYRDTTLAADVQALYAIGVFFRERTFFDTTCRFGGIAGNVRFLVVTSSVKDLSGLSECAAWGLCVLGSNELFKVIDVQRHGAQAQITLLHVPETFETYFKSVDAHHFESRLIPQTRADFQEARQTPVLADLTDPAWTERTELPPGLDIQGRLIVA